MFGATPTALVLPAAAEVLFACLVQVVHDALCVNALWELAAAGCEAGVWLPAVCSMRAEVAQAEVCFVDRSSSRRAM